MIQPGLIPLQPNLDFMDTFEPFQGKNKEKNEFTVFINIITPISAIELMGFE